MKSLANLSRSSWSTVQAEMALYLGAVTLVRSFSSLYSKFIRPADLCLKIKTEAGTPEEIITKLSEALTKRILSLLLTSKAFNRSW
jgi:hypothetical protein